MTRHWHEKKLQNVNIALHLAGALGSVAIFALVWLLVCRQLEAGASAARYRAEQLQKQLASADEVRHKHKQLSEELETSHQEAKDLALRIPDEPSEADFLAQVSRLSQQVGLQIQDYRPKATSQREAYSVLDVDLICSGDYSSICRFLDGLPTLARHSTVTDMKISAGEQGGAYQMKLTLELYYGVTAKPVLSDGGEGDG